MNRFAIMTYFNFANMTWLINHVATFSGVAHYGCTIYKDGEDCMMGSITCGFIPAFLADAQATESMLNDSTI